jgi:hypothetical protein
MAKQLTRGINVVNLDQLVEDLGVRVRVWKSTTCPNMTSIESMDHDPNCAVCSNNMIDFDCYETTAMFQQQDLVEQFKVHGTFSIDEVLATFKVGSSLQTFAKVEILDFKEEFYELIQKQDQITTNIDKLKYPACEVTAAFVIRSGAKVRFHYGTDFTLDTNGSIVWTGAHRPNDREIYSVYYLYHPVYRVTKAVHRDRFSQYNDLRDLAASKIPQSAIKTVNGRTFVKLPETWVLRRDYLLDRKDATQNTPTKLQPNEYYDPNEA